MKSGEVKAQGGVRRSEPVNLRLGFCDEDVGYSIDIGLPPPQKPPPDPPSKFERDPEIKREAIFAAPVYRPGSALVERRNAFVRIREEGSEWTTLSNSLQNFESMLSELSNYRWLCC